MATSLHPGNAGALFAAMAMLGMKKLNIEGLELVHAGADLQ